MTSRRKLRAHSTQVTAVPFAGQSQPGFATASPVQWGYGAHAGPVRRRTSTSSGVDKAVVLIATLLAAIAFGRVHQLFPLTNTLPVGKILFPLLVGLLLLSPLQARLTSLKRTPQAWALFAFVGTICVSVPFSLLGRLSLSELIEFLQTSVILVLGIGLAVQDRRDLQTLVTGIVVSVALLGGATAMDGMASGGAGRFAASGTYDPNDTAFACVAALPMAFWLLARGRWWFHRLAGLAGIGGALLGVNYSGSRGGFVGLAAVVVALLLAHGRRAVPLKWRVGFLVLVCVGLSQAPSSFWTRVATLSDMSGDYNLESATGRKQIWQRGIGYAADRPLWGVGFRAFNSAEGKLSGPRTPGVGWKWSTAHNSPIQVVAELGFLGLVAWLGLYVPTWRRTRRFERDRGRAPDPMLEGWGPALRVSLVGFFVAGFFLSQAYGGVAMTLAGLGIATTRLINQSFGPSGPGRLPSRHAARRRSGPLPASATGWPDVAQTQH